MTENNQQYQDSFSSQDGAPEPPAGYTPAGYDSADDVEWDETDTGVEPDDGFWQGSNAFADSADDNPWADARRIDQDEQDSNEPRLRHGAYEANRRNPTALLGITTSMKVLWVALGFFLGIFSPIIAFFLYRDRDPLFRIQVFRFVAVGLILGALAQLMLLSMFSSMYPELFETATSEGAGWTSTNF